MYPISPVSRSLSHDSEVYRGVLRSDQWKVLGGPQLWCLDGRKGFWV